jgi:hypothetical protein
MWFYPIFPGRCHPLPSTQALQSRPKTAPGRNSHHSCARAQASCWLLVRDSYILPSMTNTNRLKYLRIVLVVVGLVCVVGFYPLTIVWPSGWAWHTGHSMYLQMILGIYATLGIFLLLASRDPLAHRSLIGFTVWSSVVHGGIMAAQSLVYPEHRGHLFGDVPVLFLVAALLAWLMPSARGQA